MKKYIRIYSILLITLSNIYFMFYGYYHGIVSLFNSGAMAKYVAMFALFIGIFSGLIYLIEQSE